MTVVGAEDVEHRAGESKDEGGMVPARITAEDASSSSAVPNPSSGATEPPTTDELAAALVAARAVRPWPLI